MTDFDDISATGMGAPATTSRFYGKYRGIVTDIEDPLFLGRIKAKVPDVLGEDESGWALPCAPAGGSGMGFFALPVKDALVWIEFEQGDPDFPVWTGCFWGSASDVPSDLLTPEPYKKVMLVTAGGVSLTLDDTPGSGGIVLQTANGQKLSMTSTGITIDNGQGAKITMETSKVSINDGGLEVLY
jgi:uncharacterized protein involved in type VI secretion and phage assembly